MEEGSSNGVGMDLGMINGTLMENLFVNGRRENITNMGCNGGAEKKEQKPKENLISKEHEENSKGKEHTINGHINGFDDVEEHGTKGKEREEVGVGATHGGNINAIALAGSGEQSHVAQKWKQRAMAGQQWPPTV